MVIQGEMTGQRMIYFLNNFDAYSPDTLQNPSCLKVKTVLGNIDKALKTTFTFNMNSPKFGYGLSRILTQL